MIFQVHSNRIERKQRYYEVLNGMRILNQNKNVPSYQEQLNICGWLHSNIRHDARTDSHRNTHVSTEQIINVLPVPLLCENANPMFILFIRE